MFLNPDGTINALGYLESYPEVAPSFITHVFWKWNGGDKNNPANWTDITPPSEEPIEVELP